MTSAKTQHRLTPAFHQLKENETPGTKGRLIADGFCFSAFRSFAYF
jgi:hypothetical protein